MAAILDFPMTEFPSNRINVFNGLLDPETCGSKSKI